MNCPKCHKLTEVVDSRRSGRHVRRRRSCPYCHYRFSTVEKPIGRPPVSKGGALSPQQQSILNFLVGRGRASGDDILEHLFGAEGGPLSGRVVISAQIRRINEKAGKVLIEHKRGAGYGYRDQG